MAAPPLHAGAAKSERDAQKALLLVGILSQVSALSGFVTGLLVRAHMPGILPDGRQARPGSPLYPAPLDTPQGPLAEDGADEE